jgi:hypothetical protein
VNETDPAAGADRSPGIDPALDADSTPEADSTPKADSTPEAGDAVPPDTAPQPSSGPMTMAEYEEAMSPRAQLARARGLSAPYIPGGHDPNPEQGLREERHYMRLLIWMVVAIVGGGFALSILYVLVTGGN